MLSRTLPPSRITSALSSPTEADTAASSRLLPSRCTELSDPMANDRSGELFLFGFGIKQAQPLRRDGDCLPQSHYPRSPIRWCAVRRGSAPGWPQVRSDEEHAPADSFFRTPPLPPPSPPTPAYHMGAPVRRGTPLQHQRRSCRRRGEERGEEVRGGERRRTWVASSALYVSISGRNSICAKRCAE